MIYKKRLAPYFFLLFIVSLLTSSCQTKQTKHKTDIDNLYAFKRTPAQKDSISKKHETAVKAFFASEDQPQEELDQLINDMRWSSNQPVFFSLINLATERAKKEKDFSRLAKVYEDVAVFYHDNQQLDSVYAYYLKAEKFYGKTGDSLALAENIYYQARLLFEVGFVNESENKLYQALKILEKTPNHPIHIESNQLKTFYITDITKHPEALQTLLDTYKILKKDEGKYEILPEKTYNLAMSNLLGNLGIFYQEFGQLDQAESYTLEALRYYKKSKAAEQLYAHLNTTYYNIRYEQGKEDDIIEHLTNSYAIYTRLNHPFYAIEACHEIAQKYKDFNQPEKALMWLNKAYDLADEHHFYKLKKYAVQELLFFYSDQPSTKLIQELVDLTNLLENTQVETKGRFAKIEYNSFLLEQENETLKQKIYLLYLSALVVIGSLVFFLIWFRLKSKNRELAHTNSQKSKNEQILNLLIENNTIEHVTTLKERNRIAKDLHDGVINSIFTLRFNTQLLEIPNKNLKEMLVNELIYLENKIRDISHSFAQTSIFRNKSFENLLIELVHKQSNKDKTNFSITLEDNVRLDQLSTLQKINIYQIIQEALQNVNKHAQASTCKLRIYTNDTHLIFEVKDNGSGMKKTTHRGIGLSNMTERAAIIQAELKIQSHLQEGMAIVLFLNY